MRLIRQVASLIAGLLLCACGTVLPAMDLQYNTDQRFADLVKAIASHVRCELRRAVAIEYAPTDPNRRFLYDWAAKVALTIRATEHGSLNPSASLINSLSTFVFSFGGQLESTAAREMTMTYYVPFAQLLNYKREVNVADRELKCEGIPSGLRVTAPISGDLGMHQSFQAAFQTWDGYLTLGENLEDGPFDTITHKVTFDVVGGLTASPSWKFANVTANTGTTLLSATRTSSNELLITIGPKALGDNKQLPSRTLDEAFFVERLRSAVGR